MHTLSIAFGAVIISAIAGSAGVNGRSFLNEPTKQSDWFAQHESSRSIKKGKMIEENAVILASEEIPQPDIVRRNDIVTLIYESAGLEIRTEGRALNSGPLGSQLRVLNIASRRSIVARVVGEGLVRVE